MGRNPIQEQRMKQYFLDATKEILIGEGIAALSVRNVAERAGYSYATIYNYFKGLPELISFCILDFQGECKDFIEDKTVDYDSGKKKIKLIATSYVDYLIQYPSLFNLFYIEKLSSNKVNYSSVLFLEELLSEELRLCLELKIFDETKAKGLATTINYLISGMLLLYTIRNCPEDYIGFKKQLETELDNILNTRL